MKDEQGADEKFFEVDFPQWELHAWVISAEIIMLSFTLRCLSICGSRLDDPVAWNTLKCAGPFEKDWPLAPWLPRLVLFQPWDFLKLEWQKADIPKYQPELWENILDIQFVHFLHTWQLSGPAVWQALLLSTTLAKAVCCQLAPGLLGERSFAGPGPLTPVPSVRSTLPGGGCWVKRVGIGCSFQKFLQKILPK